MCNCWVEKVKTMVRCFMRLTIPALALTRAGCFFAVCGRYWVGMCPYGRRSGSGKALGWRKVYSYLYQDIQRKMPQCVDRWTLRRRGENLCDSLTAFHVSIQHIFVGANHCRRCNGVWCENEARDMFDSKDGIGAIIVHGPPQQEYAVGTYAMQ